VLGLSSVSVPNTVSKNDGNNELSSASTTHNDDGDDNALSTPQRMSRSADTVTGSIITPAGRRSARLRAKND
jgi:hypothetical protein